MKINGLHNWNVGLMAIIVLGLAACSNEAEEGGLSVTGAVDFFAIVDNAAATRITESTWDGDEQVGMKVKDVVKTYTADATGKLSIADKPYQWEGTEYDVLAWCPMTAQQINLTNQSTDEQFYDCDLIFGSVRVSSRRVHLNFHHQMTRMWWELKNCEGYTAEEVAQAKVYFLGYGATTYNEGIVTPLGSTDQIIATRSVDEGTTRRGEAMMVPCQMWEKPLIRVVIAGKEFHYTPSVSNPVDVEKKKGELKAGNWQRYYLNLSFKELSVDFKSNINEWDSNGPDTDKGQVDTDPVIVP